MLRQAQHERLVNRRGNPLWLPFLWAATLRLRSGQAPGRPYKMILPVFLFLYSVAAAFAPTHQEVEEALTCQCGCGLTVHSCNHLQCGFAVPVKQEIAKSLSEGKGREEIVSAFLARYGEKVLSAPTTSGFNLMAWIMPFLAVLIGGVAVGFVTLRWTRRRPPEEPRTPPVTSSTAQYRDRLHKELETFES